jgi:hypothetical protein
LNSPNALRDLRAVLKHLASGERWEQESDQVARCRRALVEVLPEPLAKGCSAWIGDDTTLVLTCASGTIAGKLRHLSPRIMHHFRAAAFQVRSIRIEVQADRAPRVRAGKRARTLTEPAEVAGDLEALARRIAAPGLSVALLRLARRLRDDDPPASAG